MTRVYHYKCPECGNEYDAEQCICGHRMSIDHIASAVSDIENVVNMDDEDRRKISAILMKHFGGDLVTGLIHPSSCTEFVTLFADEKDAIRRCESLNDGEHLVMPGGVNRWSIQKFILLEVQ